MASSLWGSLTEKKAITFLSRISLDTPPLHNDSTPKSAKRNTAIKENLFPPFAFAPLKFDHTRTHTKVGCEYEFARFLPLFFHVPDPHLVLRMIKIKKNERRPRGEIHGCVHLFFRHELHIVPPFFFYLRFLSDTLLSLEGKRNEKI